MHTALEPRSTPEPPRMVTWWCCTPTPFGFDRFEKDGHWDYAALSDQFVKADPEAGLLAVAQRMRAVDEHFEYDLSTYVSRPRDVRTPTAYLPWSDWWDFGYGGLVLGPGYYYSGWWR